MNRDKLKTQLEIDEGKRPRMYKDQFANLTVGVGHNLAVPISEAAIQAILDGDVDIAVAALDASFPWWRELDDDRQDALVNMAFNLGIVRLSGFHDFLAALQAHQYGPAADAMLKSVWASQVGDRAKRLSTVIRGATW